MPSIVDLQPELEALMAEYGLTSIHRNFQNADGRAVPNLALLMQSYRQRSNSGQFNGSFTDFVHETYNAGQSPSYGMAPVAPVPPNDGADPWDPPVQMPPPSSFHPPGVPLNPPPPPSQGGGGMGPFPPGGDDLSHTPPPNSGGMGPHPPQAPGGNLYASFGFTRGPNGEYIPLMLGQGASPYQTSVNRGAVSGLLGGAPQQGGSVPPLLGQPGSPPQGDLGPLPPPQIFQPAPTMPQPLPPPPPGWLTNPPGSTFPMLPWGQDYYVPAPPPTMAP